MASKTSSETFLDSGSKASFSGFWAWDKDSFTGIHQDSFKGVYKDSFKGICKGSLRGSIMGD